jgi:hypothetical protein
MTVDAGDECNITENCPEGLLCGGVNDDGTFVRVCTPPLELGDPCVDDNLCPEGTFCGYDPGLNDTICAEVAQLGEPCGIGCDRDLYCAHASIEDQVGTCQPLRNEGEACFDPYTAPYSDACRYPLQCMSDGLCHAAGDSPGDPCDWRSSYTCTNGLWCEEETHVCREPVATGEPCNLLMGRLACAEGESCQCTDPGGECYAYDDMIRTVDVCTALIADGEPCMSNGQDCESNFCGDPQGDGTDECIQPSSASGCFGPPP